MFVKDNMIKFLSSILALIAYGIGIYLAYIWFGWKLVVILALV